MVSVAVAEVGRSTAEVARTVKGRRGGIDRFSGEAGVWVKFRRRKGESRKGLGHVVSLTMHPNASQVPSTVEVTPQRKEEGLHTNSSSWSHESPTRFCYIAHGEGLGSVMCARPSRRHG